MNLRYQAIQALLQLFQQGRSLNIAQQTVIAEHQLEGVDAALLKALSYYFQLSGVLKPRLKKPLKDKDRDVYLALMLGAFQLRHMRVPAHAAINETVNAVKQLGKPWAASLVNAILRQIQRQPEDSANDPVYQYNHPAWLLDMLQKAWPEQWQDIVAANDVTAPMHLRCNRQRVNRDEYLCLLQAAELAAHVDDNLSDAMTLKKPVLVNQLPGFNDGAVSVQDLAAQQVVQLVAPQSEHRILDACAAPGGKTAHILEACPDATVTALDIDEERAEKVSETLVRLQLTGQVLAADVTTSDWWDGQPFDTILVDAPCSGTGVIRRHPDIKLLRRADDIVQLAEQQWAIVQQAWQMLKPGGKLVYTTCSILPAENDALIARCMDAWSVGAEAITLPYGQATKHGWQCLPTPDGVDGFYYAVLLKK